MNRFNAKDVAILGIGKVCDGAGFLLHKHQDGGLNGLIVILYHGRYREMRLETKCLFTKKHVN
ncbi:hypothetical protein [Bartonella tribocorum]|nr:hypothetical protein [Bartonella tribocorum]